MTLIRLATVEEVLSDAGELFFEHWDEVALNKHLMELKPNVEAYRMLEKVGGLFVLAAFRDGEMVGYSVNLITKHLHYADLVVAQNDLIFIAREHRVGRLGVRLIYETEKTAKERGARMILWHAKQDTALSMMMPRMGYGVQDILFSKEL